MEFINYYDIIERYNNTLMGGVSTMQLSLGIFLFVVGIAITLSNAKTIEKVISLIALFFVFGIAIVFVSHAVPWLNQKRANEVLTKNNLDNSFIKNANVLLDIYNKNDNKEDKVKKKK